MTSSSTAQSDNVLKYLRQIEAKRSNYCALVVHLSKLQPFHRQRHLLQQAVVEFRRLTAHFDTDKDAKIFYNADGDIAYISSNRDPLFYEKLILRFKPFFNDDPLVHASYKVAEQFYTLFDLSRQFDGLYDFAEKKFSIQKSDKSPKASHFDQNAYIESTEVRSDVVVEVEKLLKQVNVSNFIRRQQVYSIYNDNFIPLTSEFYLSLGAIEQVMIPGTHLLANPWLSRYFMQLLDKRMIVALQDMFKEKKNISYNINLSLRTAFTPSFHEYIQKSQLLGHNITVEIDHIDFIVDFEAYLFALDFLKSKNIQICIDGVKKHTLDFFKPHKDYFDYLKVVWGEDLIEDKEILSQVQNSVTDIGYEKIIMSRADSKIAFDVALKLGIKNFQGFWFDKKAQENLAMSNIAKT